MSDACNGHPGQVRKKYFKSEFWWQMSAALEKKLILQLKDIIAPAAPGVQIQVHLAGKKVCDIAVGDTYPYYDLASLTKIIFTVQALIQAFEEGKWNLKSKVVDFCPWFPHSEVKIVDCLNHSSGLVWWLPLYQSLDLNTSRINRWTEGARILRSLELENKGPSVYSDIGFLLLGHVLENMYSLPLIEIWQNLKAKYYPGTTLDFHEDNQPKNAVKFYAPTERCRWRKKVIQGEVHDDNAWALGGVSSHSGLFGSIDDLGWFGIFLRSQLKGTSKTLVKQKTAKLFASRARPSGQGDWALGYMMVTKGSSSAGKYFSSESIGHLGFTGTSLWYDPAQDLSVAILSNRVFLGRDNKEFANLRPMIHNWIVEGLKRS
jgi:serine-type D-Ala-D-Ala carboxypeptidase